MAFRPESNLRLHPGVSRAGRHLLFCCAISVSARAQQLPTPAALTADIAAHGAKAVVARLNRPPVPPNTHNAWDLVIGQIHLGQAAYIRLAPRLAGGTDAGTSEDLAISLAFALTRDPADVLAVVDFANRPPLAVTRVCGAPFVEDTIRDLPAYLRNAHDRVAQVSRPQLLGAKAACLQQLDTAASR